jgi:hypothetical protein
MKLLYGDVQPWLFTLFSKVKQMGRKLVVVAFSLIFIPPTFQKNGRALLFLLPALGVGGQLH